LIKTLEYLLFFRNFETETGTGWRVRFEDFKKFGRLFRFFQNKKFVKNAL
jgi:nitrate reductase beta subunit